MEAKRDYYEVLGLNQNADASAVKKAYRKLAKKYHPDTNTGNQLAEQKFKEITEAYSILSDPEKKKMYDQFGPAAFEQGAGAGGFEGDICKDIFRGRGDSGFWREGFGGGGFYRNGFDWNGFGSSYGRKFGGAYWGKKGSDLRARLSVSFDEAVFGCDKVITFQDAAGTGQSKSFQVHIPAGIDTGKSIRLRGRGMPGSGGGEPGDLLIEIQVRGKQGYERKGMDVYTTVDIPYTTAAFGGEVRVPTLYGDVMCKIREGTRPGSKIRLRGKGIVSVREPSVHGDQYTTVQIQVP